jgi:WD40 repeat protein
MAIRTNLEPSRVLSGHSSPVQTLAFAPDGAHIATGDTSMQMHVWRHHDRVLTINVHEEWDKVRPTERIRGAAFSRSGDRLFVAAGQALMCYDLLTAGMTGSIDWSYIAPRHFGFLIVSPLTLSVSKLDHVAAAFDNGSIGVWPTNGASRKVWHDNSAPRLMAFMPDGQRLVGTDSFSVSVWDSSIGVRLARRRFDERIYGFAASPIEDLVAVRTLESISILRLDDGSTVGQAQSGIGLPLLAFSPLGGILAAGSRSAIELLSLDGAQLGTIHLHGTKLTSLAFSPDGSRIAAGCSDGTVRLWDVD